MSRLRTAGCLALAMLAGCATARFSEMPLDASQVVGLPTGIERSELIERIGLPAEEAGYPRLEETVLTWRLIEPGSRHWVFNAHFDPSGHVKYYSKSLDWKTLGGGRRG